MLDAVEARITTTIDVAPYVERKRLALATHASQIEESFWARLPAEAFSALFGEESFIRAEDTTDAPLPEADLFDGLRENRSRGEARSESYRSRYRAR